MSRAFTVTLDAHDPQKLGAFWALALGYEREQPPTGFATWEDWCIEQGMPQETWNDYNAICDPAGTGPRIFLQRVLEAKSAKNRLHLDVVCEPRKDHEAMDALAQDLVAAGATRGETFDSQHGYWIVMADPEGNEFCIV